MVELVQFLRAEQGAGRERSSVAWSRRQRAIDDARDLSQSDCVRRWEIEACLLSGQSDEEIAARLRTEPLVIDWFEKLFFDVRENREAHDWIQTCAIGLAGPLPGDRRVGRFWKQLGYFGGPVVLDLFVSEFHRIWRPGMVPSVRLYFEPSAGIPLEVQAVVAMCHLPLSIQSGVDASSILPLIAQSKAATSDEVRDELWRHAQLEAVDLYLRRPVKAPPREKSKTPPVGTKSEPATNTNHQSATRPIEEPPAPADRRVA